MHKVEPLLSGRWPAQIIELQQCELIAALHLLFSVGVCLAPLQIFPPAACSLPQFKAYMFSDPSWLQQCSP